MAEAQPAPPTAPPAAAVSQLQEPDALRAVALFMMVVAILYFGREVLVPVTLALLLAFLLAPLVGLLRRIRLGRIPSVLLGVVVALGVVLAIGGVIGTQIAELTGDLPRYAATVERKVDTAKRFTVGRLSAMADRIEGQRGPQKTAPSGGADSAAPAHQAAPAQSAPQQGSSSPLELAWRILSPLLSPVETFGIVFVVAVFALLQREDLRDRLIRLAGSDDLHRTTLAMDDGGRRLSKYFITQLSINTAFGLVVGLGLLVIGVPNPVLWGILSALLRFVPYVGSFIAAVLPVALAAAVDPGWSMALWTLGLYVGVEALTGQVVEPMVYGHSTGLSPFSVVVAAIFWSWLWGPVGLILSTPLTLCLVVLGRHIKRLEFLDVLLGDRPALTPVESFYQRILAGDADEAQDHAEAMLRERSLCSYYDEVALKGLQLAANDAIRGVLGHAQLDRVRATIKALVEGLASHDDVPPAPRDKAAEPPPDDETECPETPPPPDVHPAEAGAPEAWRRPASVLCIAGRGPLDEAASAMLAQLLGKHGLGGHPVSYAAVSRDQIGSLDVIGAVMACVSYLDISGSPAHLRYLIRRLRAKLPPGTPILVGLWPNEDATLKDDRVRAMIGADYYTSSLGEAVEACVQTAHKDEEPADCRGALQTDKSSLVLSFKKELPCLVTSTASPPGTPPLPPA